MRNGSTKLWVAPLSTIIVRVVSSEKNRVAEKAVVVTTNAPKAPSGCRGSAEVTASELIQAGGPESQELLLCQLIPQEPTPRLQLTRSPKPRKHPPC